MPTSNLHLGARLRAARIAAGFKSLRSFVAEYGFPLSTVAQHEAGTRAMDNKTVNQYCKILGINRKWLTTGEGEIFKNNRNPQKRMTERELAYFEEMNKLTSYTGQKIGGINQKLLVAALDAALQSNKNRKSKLSLKKCVSDAVAIYVNVIETSCLPEQYTAALKVALRAYRQHIK